MLEVNFHDVSETDDARLAFAVIAARYGGQWIFCRHRARDTWEIPGGHREPGETILDAAKRELYEETGAAAYELSPIGVYSVTDGAQSFGMLYFAEIRELGPLPESEIAEIAMFDRAPDALTYPRIQPKLFARVTKAVGET
jgi:8-oxo-dGTP diphosphatase